MTQPPSGYLITGLEDSGVQTRLELRDLQDKPIHWSLFIRGLIKIQQLKSPDPTSPEYGNKPNSWWQIGGIHGLPYDSWSGDPRGKQIADPKSKWGGYCYHSSAVFPTWHRVLVMLVEQAVVKEAIKYAETETSDNDDWKQAANELRFPFWDWTKTTTAAEGIPQIFRDATVDIKKPDGPDETVDNPLNHYRFAGKQAAAANAAYMGDWERTYRWAKENEEPIEEDYEQSVKAFSQGGSLKVGNKEYNLHSVDWLRAGVAGLFKYPLTIEPSYEPNMWGLFASNGDEGIKVPGPLEALSLANIEDPHDTVHLNVGGNGTMSMNEYAGFDPIFYLHHCNIDRLYAFWEYVYPNYWINEGWKDPTTEATVQFKNGGGTFIQDAIATVDRGTYLGPFRKQQEAYWTSDNARGLLSDVQISDEHESSSTKKYYTYPPIGEVQVNNSYDPDDETRRRKYRRILYKEWSPDLSLIAKIYQALADSMSMLSHLIDFLFKKEKEKELVNLRQFYLIGQLPEFAFPRSGSYRLELYILPKLSSEEGIVVNSISVLGRADPSTCASCRKRQAAGSRIRGYMPLDPIVMLHLICDHLNPNDYPSAFPKEKNPSEKDLSAVLSALIQESLGMRLVKPDGTILAVTKGKLSSSQLDEARAPKVSFYSHIIKYNPVDPTDDISFETPVSYGPFKADVGWTLFEAGPLVYTSDVRRKAYIPSCSQV